MYIPKLEYKAILANIPIVCVDLIIINDGKFLLLKRDNEPAKGEFWFPGGRILKLETIKNGIYNLKHGDYIYPITLQLIKDGRKNKVLNKKIMSKIQVTMIHGQKDEVVPVSYSRKVLKIFKKAKKKK